MIRVRTLILAGLAAGAAVLLFGGAGALGQVAVQHGIGFTKGCVSPTQIGAPYSCTYSIRNILDTAQDTLTINGLVDVVHAFPQTACPGPPSTCGDVSSSSVFGSAALTFQALTITAPAGSTATCSGTVGPPGTWTHSTFCTLPFGSRLNVQSFSHYIVQPADFNLPGHNLQDSAQLTWHDLCDGPFNSVPTNCDTDPPTTGASSQSVITQLSSTTATNIHNAAHSVVTAIAAGSTVHDFVTVTGQPGSPSPSGNVTVDWFLNGDCSGNPAVNSGPIALAANGTVDAIGFAFTVNSVSQRAFRAHYLGDGTYTASDGPCEPLLIVAPPVANVVIPTLNDWTLVALALLLAGAAMNGLRRRSR